MRHLLLTSITAALLAALLPSTAGAYFKLDCHRWIGAGGPVICKLKRATPSACTPCVNGCDADNNCLDESYGGPEWPITADDTCQARLVPAGEDVRLPSEEPFIMAGPAWVGTCADGYAWVGESGVCQDSAGTTWPCEPQLAAVAEVALSSDAACFHLEAPEVQVSTCGADITACVGDDCIDFHETRPGCQYWGPEGPDDIAVCVLTVADEACNGCISGEPWRSHTEVPRNEAELAGVFLEGMREAFDRFEGDGEFPRFCVGDVCAGCDVGADGGFVSCQITIAGSFYCGGTCYSSGCEGYCGSCSAGSCP